jgi:uncharacterized membrane protein YczE
MKVQIDRVFINRVLFYLLGLLFTAVCLCLLARANVGIAPIGSISFIFSYITGLSLGTTQLIINITFILIQVVWLGRDFDKFQYFQILSSIIFSVFVDILMLVTPFLDYTKLSLPLRFVELFVSILCAAAGLCCLKMVRMAMLPADGLVQTISLKLKQPFGKVRVFFDCSCVMLTVLVSLAALRRVEGIQVGTVIAALSTGNCMRVLLHFIEKRMSPLFIRPEGVLCQFTAADD